MYKHILLPTDGSALSEVAIDNGLRFAKAVGARVTGLYVMVEHQVESFEGYAPTDVKSAAPNQLAKAEAQRYLGAIAAKATAARIEFYPFSMSHPSPLQRVTDALRALPDDDADRHRPRTGQRVEFRVAASL